MPSPTNAQRALRRIAVPTSVLPGCARLPMICEAMILLRISYLDIRAARPDGDKVQPRKIIPPSFLSLQMPDLRGRDQLRAVQIASMQLQECQIASVGRLEHHSFGVRHSGVHYFDSFQEIAALGQDCALIKAGEEGQFIVKVVRLPTWS